MNIQEYNAKFNEKVSEIASVGDEELEKLNSAIEWKLLHSGKLSKVSESSVYTSNITGLFSFDNIQLDLDNYNEFYIEIGTYSMIIPKEAIVNSISNSKYLKSDSGYTGSYQKSTLTYITITKSGIVTDIKNYSQSYTSNTNYYNIQQSETDWKIYGR